jgi:electron transport complex protein RnfB
MAARPPLLDNALLSIDRPMSLIQRIDALLPQTQCGKCGHPGCRPYAQGIAAGEPINRCPPGGSETIAALAALLDTPALPLDTQRGHAPAQVAYIREAECIGCTKCIQACPVDAILGAAKLMHTVLVDECTGCDLCVAPCPVDCIDLIPLERLAAAPIALVGGLAATAAQRDTRAARRDQARRRFEQRQQRLQREAQRKQALRQARTAPAPAPAPAALVAAPTPGAPMSAIERIKAKKALAEDNGLKQAKIAVAMTRAQLNKTRQAYTTPPILEHFCRLQALQDELDAAEVRLQRLSAPAQDPSPR